MSDRVLVIGPNGGATVYKSVSATSRALSGIGADTLRHTIADRCVEGGGYVGANYVQYTTHPGGIRRPWRISL